MPRVKLLTDYTYSPTKPASEDAIRSEIDDAIQEVYDAAAKPADTVNLIGNQTVAGIKTFQSSPIIPAPTTDLQASTKKYVDDGLLANKNADHSGTWQGYTPSQVDQTLRNEVVNARTSSVYGTFTNLKERVDNSDIKIRDLAVNVKDFGAIGDGITDDTIAIQNAINASEGKKLLIPKTASYYLITSQLDGVSNISIISNGATIKSGNTRISESYIKFDSKQNIEIKGVVFDLNMQNMSIYQIADYPNLYNVGLNFNNCENIDIRKNKFLNLYTESIKVYGSIGVCSIEENYFTSPIQAQTQILNHIEAGSSDCTMLIKGNHINNDAYTNPNFGVCGVYAYSLSGNIQIKENFFNYCGRNNAGTHKLAVIDLYSYCRNVTIADNKIENCMWNGIRIAYCENIKVHGNEFEFSYTSTDTVITLSASSVDFDLKNIEIYSNIFKSNVINTYVIGGQVEHYHRPYKNINIHHNYFENVLQAVRLLGVVEGFKVNDNTFKNVNTCMYMEKTSSGTSVLIESETKWSDVEFKNNICNNVSFALSWNQLSYTGKLDNIYKISENKVISNLSSQAIVTNGIKVKVNNNIVENSSIGLYLRNASNAYIENNMLYGNTTAINSASITTVVKTNNYSNDVLIP